MDEFQNKTYLVAGATSGIGKSVSEMLAARGANVLLMARNAQALQKTVAALPAGAHDHVPCDVSRLDVVAPAIASFKERYGKIDGLVWCVGLGKVARLRDLGINDMQMAFATSCFASMEAVKELMHGKPKKQPLRVVAISSLASTEFQKYLTLYAGAKAALEAVVRCLSSELGPRNVRINCIRPAFVNTPRLAGLNDITGNVEESIKKYQPLGLIDANDVADAVLFMLSDSASHINGTSWEINGGAAC